MENDGKNISREKIEYREKEKIRGDDKDKEEEKIKGEEKDKARKKMENGGTIQEVYRPSNRSFRRTYFNSPPTSLVQKNFFSAHKNVTLPLGPTHGITLNARRSFKTQCKSQQYWRFLKKKKNI